MNTNVNAGTKGGNLDNAKYFLSIYKIMKVKIQNILIIMDYGPPKINL